MHRKSITIPLLLIFAISIPAFVLAQSSSPAIYFSDGFESGLGKWEVSGLDWAVIDTAARSGSHSITDSPAGNYAVCSNSAITLKSPINLSAATAPVLSFWDKVFTAYTYNTWDRVYGQISQDGGFTWTTIYDNYGTRSSWDRLRIDLTPYKNKPLLLRFRMADDCNGGATADGWYIDDVEISEKDTASTPYPFTDDFENGLDNWSVSGLDWAVTDTAARSGSRSITDSPARNYGACSGSVIELAHPINLSAATAPVLSFWDKVFTAYTYNTWDRVYGQISQDGGFTWTTIYDSYGTRSSWGRPRIDLTPYKNKPLLLRFRMADDCNGGATADGWYVDDVEIKERDPRRPSLAVSVSPPEGGTVISNGISCPGVCVETIDSTWLVSGRDWAVIDTAARGGTHSITDSPGANYGTCSYTAIELSDPINLSSATAPVLSFWDKVSTAYTYNTWDHVYGEISQDGGFTWTNVYDTYGTRTSWLKSMIDLTPYKNKPLLLRFRMYDDCNGGATADGWYIDDVLISELNTATVYFSDGFETFDSLPDFSNRVLTANPNPGYQFTGWEGCTSVNGNQCTVNTYVSKVVTAKFSYSSCTPGALSVTPADGLTSSGNQGGPFSPSSKSYTLQNTASAGGCAINWTASKTMPWVTLSATGAALAAGASTTVTVSINTSANSLAAGSYGDTVTFTNTTNGSGNTTRPVSLTVTGSNRDLVVSALSGPTIVAPGTSYTYSVTTKNQGTALAAASTTRLYFSTDTTWQATDPQIGSGCPVGSLAAGATFPCSITGAVPPGLATGKYYVIAKADADNAVAETNETNNTRSLTVYAGPDLVVSALSGPTIVAPGTSYTYSVTTKNQGTALAAASTTRLYFSTDSTWQATDPQIGSGCAVGSLAAGASASCAITGAIPPGLATGRYYVIAKADADNVVVEANETNNTRSLTVYVGPDLAVSALSGPTIVAPGTSYTYSVTTKNQGTALAAASTTRLYFSTDSTWQTTDGQIGSGCAVGSLAAGATFSCSITGAIPTGLATGKYYVIAKADADNAVVEANETNNTRSLTVYVGPDLVTSALSGPTIVAPGTSYTYSVTTKNQGTALAAASTARLYFSTDSTWQTTDGQIGSGCAVGALAAGASASCAITGAIPPGLGTGKYYVIAKADADNAVAEANETNNTKSLTVYVGPDLVISTLSGPSTVVRDTPVTLTVDTGNSGSATAGTSVTRVFISTDTKLDAGDLQLASFTVPAIGAGAPPVRATPTVTVPASVGTGTRYFLAVADATGLVAESQETNNLKYKTITVQ